MITLVIATLLLTMGIPSFSAMIQNNRLSTQANAFIATVNYARSEAIKRRTNVDITAKDSANNANEWGPGWEIKVGDTVIRSFAALDGSSSLNSNGGHATFRYDNNGRVNNADTLSLCDDRSGETGRLITITATGRASIAETACL